MSKKLIVSPQGGLGRRMRSIATAMVIADILGWDVYHSWLSGTPNSPLSYMNDYQSIGFSDLFDSGIAEKDSGDTIQICFSELLPGNYWYDKQNSSQVRYSITDAVSIDTNILPNITEDVILLETSKITTLSGYESTWNSMMISAYSNLVPKSTYSSKVPSMAIDIGVSIRRQDFLWYFPFADFTTGDVISWLQAQVDARSGESQINMFVFSDDHSYRDTVIAGVSASNLTIYTEADLDTTGMTDWEKAFVEFLVLSNANEVYGTPLSSFANEAANFGDTTYTQILS